MPSLFRLLTAAACVLTLGGARAQWDVAGAGTGRYADPDNHFSLQVPAGWQATVKNGATILRRDKSTLTVFFDPGADDSGEMLDAPVRRVREAGKDYAPDARAACTVGGYDGTTLAFAAKGPEGVASRGRILTLTNGRDGVAMVLISPADVFKAEDGVLWDTANTLSFSPRPQVDGPHLEEGTPVHLRLNHEVKSGREHKGDDIWFTVAEPVRGPDGNTLIAKGAVASGTVLRSERRRMFGKPGKLEIGVNSAMAVDGQMVRLRATENLSRRGRSNADAVTATALLLTPLSVFVKGRDVTLAKDTEVTVFVDQDTAVKPAEPRGAENAAPASATNPPATGGGAADAAS